MVQDEKQVRNIEEIRVIEVPDIGQARDIKVVPDIVSTGHACLFVCINKIPNIFA